MQKNRLSLMQPLPLWLSHTKTPVLKPELIESQ